MSFIELKNINKFVGSQGHEQIILKNINLNIKRGEFISIIGQSGSGKSTLMNILGCLDTASSGEYTFDGENIYNFEADQLSELRLKSFGFIFQRYNLLNSLTALENVALPAIYSNLNTKLRLERAQLLLNELGMSDKVHNKPSELSGGQQQRVSIARALMNGGEVILADEPTGALDSKSGEMVLKILKDLHEKGHTIILVTHDAKIAQHAERIIEIRDGCILSDHYKIDSVIVKNVLDKYILKTKPNFMIPLYEALKMSIHSIFSNKLRSLLTMLGIIIGISSVSIILAIGKGVTQKIIGEWDGLKLATLSIYPGEDVYNPALSAASRLNIDDATALKDKKNIAAVSPSIAASGNMIYQNKNVKATANGADKAQLQIANLKLEYGRFLTSNDIEKRTQVTVIDLKTSKSLFGKAELSIGKSVLFNKRPLEVIGVVKSKFDNPGNTAEIWLPYTTLESQISGKAQINSITVLIDSRYNSKLVEKDIEHFLSARHGVKDFTIFSSEEGKKSATKVLGTITFFVSAVAFISLLVGGIGVMNIMLVSVTERIKEIGIRMAVGAKQQNVLTQFLIEAAILCFFGGLLGVSISFIIGIIFNIFSPEYKMVFSIWVTLMALFFSSIIGLIFGYLPAKRASNLKPIEALAHE
ncbi:ABC transporter permease [Acinetobacter sp.]|jgi:macrolide transport system ATP-binding/permease protein|uniref:ABC transporter permease n=1 Tax=Acinetobacter sp. TaxID=472 RepID=UPI00282B1F97|nr:ABC transporter permease [Acinetobacter sp.]MDR2248598.1 ABC transporter permease [Acinetobacter sp.]